MIARICFAAAVLAAIMPCAKAQKMVEYSAEARFQLDLRNCSTARKKR